MAKNNLAGLAALGALGMMMSKGKGKSTEVEEPGEINERMDRANAISRGRTNLVDTGMSTPEPDENYRNSGPRTGPASVGRVSSTGGSSLSLPSRDNTISPSRGSLANDTIIGGVGTAANGGSRLHPEYPEDIAPAELRDNEDNMRKYKPRRTPQANSTTAEGMRNYVSRAPSGMKKGGVVKMAKGGMTSSASRRADGIASKGKTRGKIC